MMRMIKLTDTIHDFSKFLKESEFIYSESNELWMKDDGEIFFTAGICEGKIVAMMTSVNDEFEEIQTDNLKKFKNWMGDKHEH